MAKIVRNGLLYGSSDSADITYDNTSSRMTASTVQGAVDEVKTNVGDLSTLDTTEKGSAVGAINELNGNLGSLTNLDTTDKTSAVEAINEVVTTVKDSLEITDGATTKNIRFGVDGDGNYGYYKADDSFAPFKAGEDIEFIAQDYDDTKTYSKDDYVIAPDGLLYKIKADGTTGTWAASFGDLVKLTDISGSGKVEEFKAIAQEFSATATYNDGSIVLKDDKLYQCNTDSTIGWDASKFDEVMIPDISNSNLANDVVLATYRSNTVGYAYYGEQNNVCNLTYTFTSNYKRVIVFTRNILSGTYNSTNEVTNFTSNNSSKVQPYWYEIKNVVENQTFTATYTGLKTQTDYDNKVEAVIIGFN